MTQTHLNYRPDIDGLRAIAVLAVVAFHAFPKTMTGGFTGVDVFFVISGFLISTILYGSLERNQFSLIDFYGRRIRRIFPALLLVLAACFAVGWFVLLPDEYAQLGKHMAGGAGFVQNLVLWGESDYFDNAAETKPLLHLWSLGIEEQFYIFWPLILWLGYRLRFNLLAITLLLAAISFVLNIRGINVTKDLTATFYSPQTRFWELLIGATLAYLNLHSKVIIAKWPILSAIKISPQVWANVRATFGIVLLVLGFVLINKQVKFPGWWALLPSIGAVLILSAGSGAWINKTIFSNRVLVWFGLISYPLYLWHWALLSFARILEGGTPSEWVRAGLILISIALSAATYYLIEKPIRFGKHQKAKTITLIILMAVVGFVGYNTYKRDGLGFRMPRELLELNNYSAPNERDKHYVQWHRYKCFLEEFQTFTDYSKCAEFEKTEHQVGKPNLLIWGDSHAASLAPGFRGVHGEQFNIYQRTTALCPPILGYVKQDRPNCTEINDNIFSYIQRLKPDVIILSAWWNDYDWSSIKSTIKRLKTVGINEIYLVGPLPQWEDHLPNLVYRQYKSDPLRKTPIRMKRGLKSDFSDLDARLRLIAEEARITYISPREILCNPDGCLTLVNKSDRDFIAFDTAHLTVAGARYVVSRIKVMDKN